MWSGKGCVETQACKIPKVLILTTRAECKEPALYFWCLTMNGYPMFFVGPGEPTESEQRKKGGAEVQKAGERESVPLTLKEQHANYIQSNMQIICKLLFE